MEKKQDAQLPELPLDEERVAAISGYDAEHDVFGNEAGHSIQYKTLSWQMVAVLMIAEIVSNGMLSLPSSAGVVGVCIFLGKYYLKELGLIEYPDCAECDSHRGKWILRGSLCVFKRRPALNKMYD
jgi:hypothetical protein